jgi:Holliday junction resolvase RusA-like endonuclease
MSKAPHEVNWTAYIAMPESWPKKKKTAMEGRPHRAKPDRDNIDKAILDSLWESDSCVSDGVIRKRWCWAGEERLEVEVIG